MGQEAKQGGVSTAMCARQGAQCGGSALGVLYVEVVLRTRSLPARSTKMSLPRRVETTPESDPRCLIWGASRHGSSEHIEAVRQGRRQQGYPQRKHGVAARGGGIHLCAAHDAVLEAPVQQVHRFFKVSHFILLQQQQQQQPASTMRQECQPAISTRIVVLHASPRHRSHSWGPLGWQGCPLHQTTQAQTSPAVGGGQGSQPHSTRSRDGAK